MPSLNDYAIKIEGVTKRFPKLKRYREMLFHPFKREEITALRGVDLRVKKGELFGLLGVNGAGKTTLIKILCTLVHPNEGEAWVNGFDTTKHSWEIRKTIGYVISEERSFYWRLTGRQNLEFFAALYNLNQQEAQKRIKSVLKLLDLTNSADKMFKDYSTGMRQKLAIARGLLTDPLIVFMDEPTRSLDPLAAHHLRDFVIQEIVGRQGRTVFFSTHNLQEAEICQRIAILDEGKIKLCDEPAKIREQYSRPRCYLKTLNPDPEQVNRVLNDISWIKRVKMTPGNGLECKVEFEPGRGAISELVKRLVQNNVSIEACYPLKATLEEIFGELTSKESGSAENDR